MKNKDLLNNVQMLLMQLREEERDYVDLLADKSRLSELQKINQRIVALKNLLLSLQTYLLFESQETLPADLLNYQERNVVPV